MTFFVLFFMGSLFIFSIVAIIYSYSKDRPKIKVIKTTKKQRLEEQKRREAYYQSDEYKEKQRKLEEEELEKQRKLEEEIAEQKRLEEYYQSDEYKALQQKRLEERKEELRIKKEKREEALRQKQAKLKAEQDWLNGFTELDIPNFFNMYEKKKQAITGVYIIHNNSKNKYYVGQAVKIFDRVYNHFTGNGGNAGSKELFYDYVKTRDQFTVKIVPLNKSNFASLDALEKYFINKFNAKAVGYNKTAGNN